MDVVVPVAALLVIPTLALQVSDPEGSAATLAVALDAGIWLVFLVELLVRLRLAPDRRAWLRSHPLEVAIVVLTPPLLPAVFDAFRLVRLVRLIQVLPLLRVLRAGPLLRRVVSPQGVRWAGVLAFLLVLCSGEAFALVEDEQDLSAWDGVWWAVSTMTTVGYGDIHPRTSEGRVLAIAVMLAGIGFVALLTASIAERFIERELPDAHPAAVAAELRAVRAQLVAIEALLAAERRDGPAGRAPVEPPP
jgi:voltage-gated potassium channel